VPAGNAGPYDKVLMRQWLARLPFALFVLAFLFVWEGYRITSGRNPLPGTGRATLYFVIAGVVFGLALIGIRERHRPRD